MEWGLRPCYTWKDGYSLYRCATANRRTSKQQMLSDLLQFWRYKWHTGTNDETGAAYEKKGYQYVHDFGRDNETVLRAQEFTEDVAQKNIEAVRLVQDTLIRGTSVHLNRRYNPPEQFLESLAAIDNNIILFIDSLFWETQSDQYLLSSVVFPSLFLFPSFPSLLFTSLLFPFSCLKQVTEKKERNKTERKKDQI